MKVRKILDGTTAAHLRAWLAAEFAEQDRDWALCRIVAVLKYDPELIDDGYSWPDILSIGIP